MNKYEIMDMIDEGAYGIVWKAVNRQSGVLVAIKQFKQGDDDEISRNSIQRQIRMLKMLKGQFIVNIKEAFKKKNKIFLIFEYFPKNLLNFIQMYEQGLDSLLINKIAYKVIKCLRFLHQKNIIHRDIKPQNILLQNDAQELKLCDFGFARFLPEPYEDLTEYVATRWYRSPELLVGQKYGKPADMWALGCIIGELVDGHPMFPGQNQMDQLYLIRKALGQLPQKQLQLMSRNPKFKNINCPSLKKHETIQARYIGKIQKNALNFVKACLTLDPTKRITVEEALQHPYLLPLSMKQNQHLPDETDILYSNRKFFHKNQSQSTQKKTEVHQISPSKKQKNAQMQKYNKIQKSQQSEEIITRRSKYLGDKTTLKHVGSGSLPETSIYKVIHQPHLNPIMKKKSQATLKYNEKIPITKNRNSPKLNLKKTSFKKMPKVMSQEKKMSYNIDVKLKINLKINQKLNKGQQKPVPSRKQIDQKLPEIKNNSKLLKYRLNNNYPGQGINTIYNSYGNLSILGQSKQLSKGATNLNQLFQNSGNNTKN